MGTRPCFQCFFLIPFYLIFFGLYMMLVSGQCHINQQSVLIQLKNELQFNSSLSTKLVSWNPNATDCCAWGGVTCSTSGQVISLDLSNETISAGIDNSSVLFNLKNLESLNLAANSFNFSQIPSRFGSFASLKVLNLSNSGFSGQIPGELSQLSRLETLDLSSLFSYGIRSLRLENPNLATLVQNFTKLTGLYLDNVNISSQRSDWGHTLSSSLPNNISLVNFLPKLTILKLASCNLSKFPNLRNQSRLTTLDLSNNKLEGNIPTWIWEVGNGHLSYMNLSYNRLTGLEEPYNFPDLLVLDLHSNRLSGVIPNPPQTAIIVDYSNNLFNLPLPESIGRNLRSAYVFSVSNNALTGVIPETICNVLNLTVLDLSNNLLNGSIPNCLIKLGSNLGVLNLANNVLTGQMEGTFPSNCALNTLDLHGNSLEGEIPRSLVNCTMLRVLNLGNNMINDTYPCFLGNNTNLHVLVLQSNRFHGSMQCGQNQQNKWPKLQILDIAHNSFGGALPAAFFSQWDAMTKGNEEIKKHLSFTVLQLSEYYYQDTVTVTAKGLELALVKILMTFTLIDISDNQFSGEIPHTIGRLKALYFLNVSHNDFTGSIPPSLGNLSQLESLDMSSNKLTGEIPNALTRLPFLSTLNLSYNQLHGRIPTGIQFQTFGKDSYLGNKGLCGFPLSKACASPIVPGPNDATNFQESDNIIDWRSVLYGFGFGAAISVLFSIWKGYSSGTTRQQINQDVYFGSGYPLCVIRSINEEDINEKETSDGDENSG